MRSVTVVAAIVTYGDRADVALGAVESAWAAGADAAVLVVNGAPAAAVAALEQRAAADRRLRVVTLPDNRGSAGGYAVAMEVAAARGADVLWLLDDDNRPRSDALQRLRAAWALLGADPAVVLACHRTAFPEWRWAADEGRAPSAEPNAFFAFHLRRLVPNLRRRWRRRRRGAPRPRYPLVPLDHAPYGGLFLPRVWVARGELPRTDLWTYGDDVEYTSRLVAQGARLFLCTPAVIDDAVPAWSGRSVWRPPWLDDEEARVYVMARNLAWWERRRARSWLVYGLNGALYLAFLGVLAAARRGPRFALRRLRLTWRGVRDGWAGRLGPPRL